MTMESNNRSVTIEFESSREKARGSVWKSMLNGMRCRCPRCGTGELYRNYLKVVDECPSCDLELHHQRADDAPPYFTMFIVGHILVPLVFLVEVNWQPAWWVHLALWGPMAIVLSLWLLPVVKGAIIALQWKMGMHGFGGEDGTDQDATHLDTERH
jgi:uncharacterized protein (DUF983 family)